MCKCIRAIHASNVDRFNERHIYNIILPLSFIFLKYFTTDTNILEKLNQLRELKTFCSNGTNDFNWAINNLQSLASFRWTNSGWRTDDAIYVIVISVNNS